MSYTFFQIKVPDTKWYQAPDSTGQLFTNPAVYISTNSSISASTIQKIGISEQRKL